jgi:uncharacterized coiled-coil protein SlyX
MLRRPSESIDKELNMNEEIIKLQDRINKLELDLAHAQDGINHRDLAITNRDTIIQTSHEENRQLQAKLEQMRQVERNSLDYKIQDMVQSMVESAVENFDLEQLVEDLVREKTMDIEADQIAGLERFVDDSIEEYLERRTFRLVVE